MKNKFFTRNFVPAVQRLQVKEGMEILMLRLLWNCFEKKDWKIFSKQRAFFGAMMLLAGIIGYCIWLVISMFTLKTIDWMICFIGYSVAVAAFIAYLYICNHDFS